MDNGIVYRIFCTVNGKSYIGQTWKKLETRWKQHNRLESCCIKLRNALIKYGKDRFVIATLTSGLRTQEDMNTAEKYWISYFNSIEDGYNIREGGRGGRLSEDTREKLRKASTGRKHSKEARAKISKARLGSIASEETKEILSKAHLGHTVSEETKEKMSKAHLGQKKKRIIDQNGIVYEGVSDAAKALGIKSCNISKTLHGRMKTCRGYVFKFVEQESG